MSDKKHDRAKTAMTLWKEAEGVAEAKTIFLNTGNKKPTKAELNHLCKQIWKAKPTEEQQIWKSKRIPIQRRRRTRTTTTDAQKQKTTTAHKKGNDDDEEEKRSSVPPPPGEKQLARIKRKFIDSIFMPVQYPLGYFVAINMIEHEELDEIDSGNLNSLNQTLATAWESMDASRKEEVFHAYESHCQSTLEEEKRQLTMLEEAGYSCLTSLHFG